MIAYYHLLINLPTYNYHLHITLWKALYIIYRFLYTHAIIRKFNFFKKRHKTAENISWKIITNWQQAIHFFANSSFFSEYEFRDSLQQFRSLPSIIQIKQKKNRKILKQFMPIHNNDYQLFYLWYVLYRIYTHCVNKYVIKTHTLQLSMHI